jgi:hypothetical protein
MIENQEQLEYSIQALERMYATRSREAAETRWDPDLREMVVQSDQAMINKVEREIAEYLATKYGLREMTQEKAA